MGGRLTRDRSGPVTAPVTGSRLVAPWRASRSRSWARRGSRWTACRSQVDTRKAVALLAYLAVTGRPARREALADLLWPEYEPTNARAALRRTLSVLQLRPRRPLAVVGTRHRRARRHGVDLDVSRFRRLLADGRADEAVASLPRRLLEGFALRDSAEFDHWQIAEASRCGASSGRARAGGARSEAEARPTSSLRSSTRAGGSSSTRSPSRVTDC